MLVVKLGQFHKVEVVGKAVIKLFLHKFELLTVGQTHGDIVIVFKAVDLAPQ